MLRTYFLIQFVGIIDAGLISWRATNQLSSTELQSIDLSQVHVYQLF